MAQNRNGIWTWIHSDHLGSATVMTDKDGNVVRRLAYKPFGEEVVNTDTGEKPPYTYTGKELDSSGLMYYGARYYDPALARFITPDTVADRGTQGLNRYAYALNNPIRYNDPSGHGVVDSFLYGGWGQHVAESIQAGAASVTSFSSSLIGADSGAGMIFSVTAYNSGIDLAAGLLSGIFSLGTGTGDWIADLLDYNKIPVLGPVGQNFGTSVGEFIMEPSIETGARAVAASCQVVGTAFGTAQLARMIGIPGTKGHLNTSKASPTWKGSGPTHGVLGADASSTSTKAIQHYYPKDGGIEFVFDPKTNTFVVGSPKRGFSGSPHQQLARTIGADESTVVGGIFNRGANGMIRTNEASGHYWQNWTPEIRQQFQRIMENFRLPVEHYPGM